MEANWNTLVKFTSPIQKITALATVTLISWTDDVEGNFIVDYAKMTKT